MFLTSYYAARQDVHTSVFFIFYPINWPSFGVTEVKQIIIDIFCHLFPRIVRCPLLKPPTLGTPLLIWNHFKIYSGVYFKIINLGVYLAVATPRLNRVLLPETRKCSRSSQILTDNCLVLDSFIVSV